MAHTTSHITLRTTLDAALRVADRVNVTLEFNGTETELYVETWCQKRSDDPRAALRSIVAHATRDGDAVDIDPEHGETWLRWTGDRGHHLDDAREAIHTLAAGVRRRLGADVKIIVNTRTDWRTASIEVSKCGAL
jgi:hypothetical protein